MARTKPPDLEVEASRLEIPPLAGYPSLTKFIASDRDRTTLVFKRFDELAIRNLLLLQSELAELQSKQNGFDAEDRSFDATIEMKGCATSWKQSQEMAIGCDEKQKERVELAKEIRTKVKEYREALLLESAMATIKPPPRRTFDAIRHAFFRKDDDGTEYTVLSGNSQSLYAKNEDLVLLKHPEHQDALTAFMHDYLPILFTSGPRNGDTIYVSESRIAFAVNMMSISMAIVLLLVAIVCLHIVTKPATKIAMIGVFLLLFAGTVGMLTTAKRSEVFGATAAYAAVLVVFVSGDLGS